MSHSLNSLPELLSPAGNLEKMKAALRFGADAVYLAGKRFGMRAAADNFSHEELESAVQIAHKFQKKVYLTLNVMPHQSSLADLHSYMESLSGIVLDGIIVADLGVLSLCSRYFPNIPIHISTQAATVNSYGCMKWYEMGARRIVLAREVSLSDIAAIRSEIPDDLELETFIHGSMCVSFSGRCMLSKYYTGRDANLGECTQPCRWQFQFSEVKREEDLLNCEIYPEGSYIFGSKDLCMIDHIPELISAGINSFKIEGRMKSAYYASVVTNSYRIAMECAAKGIEAPIQELHHELNTVSHREYCTGYYYDEPMKNAQFAENCGYIGEKAYLAAVVDYCSERKAYRCIQKNKFFTNEQCEFISPGNVGKLMKINEMMDENGNKIESCPHPQMIFYIRTDCKLKAGDLIRKA